MKNSYEEVMDNLKWHIKIIDNMSHEALVSYASVGRHLELSKDVIHNYKFIQYIPTIKISEFCRKHGIDEDSIYNGDCRNDCCVCKKEITNNNSYVISRNGEDRKSTECIDCKNKNMVIKVPENKLCANKDCRVPLTIDNMKSYNRLTKTGLNSVYFSNKCKSCIKKNKPKKKKYKVKAKKELPAKVITPAIVVPVTKKPSAREKAELLFKEQDNRTMLRKMGTVEERLQNEFKKGKI